MTPELRAALRLVVESHPAGSSVPVLREHVLELLDGQATGPILEGDLTCKAAGGIIGRHDSTIRGMCERGEFPGAYRQNGREWRIPRSAVEAYRSACQRGQAPRRPRTAGKAADLGAWRKARAG